MFAVMTDNGACYKSKVSTAALGEDVKHRRTCPYQPQTNGKVEQFNQPLAAEWAYARPYASETERASTYAGDCITTIIMAPTPRSAARLQPHAFTTSLGTTPSRRLATRRFATFVVCRYRLRAARPCASVARRPWDQLDRRRHRLAVDVGIDPAAVGDFRALLQRALHSVSCPPAVSRRPPGRPGR